MLEINSAKTIIEAVKKVHDIDITLEEACRMQPISQSPAMIGYTIFALQRGDSTLLVWAKFSQVLGICIEQVKICNW